MQPYAARHYFDLSVYKAFNLATWVIGDLKERTPVIRCHELARATALIIAKHLSAEVSTTTWDGTYGAIDHSWLRIQGRLPTSSPVSSILDVYAVGRVPQVQLIDGSGVLPEATLYKIRDTRDDIDRQLVRELFAEMQAVLDAHSKRVYEELAEFARPRHSTLDLADKIAKRGLDS